MQRVNAPVICPFANEGLLFFINSVNLLNVEDDFSLIAYLFNSGEFMSAIISSKSPKNSSNPNKNSSLSLSNTKFSLLFTLYDGSPSKNCIIISSLRLTFASCGKNGICEKFCATTAIASSGFL